jgi:hypothetical protein
MPGSLFPRSPSPDESISMKHVHFTPPAPKNAKLVTMPKTNLRPEDVPLPRSRSNSPVPLEEPVRRERRASVSDQKKRGNHRSTTTSQVLSDGFLSEDSSQEPMDRGNQTRVSPTRFTRPPSSNNSVRHLGISNESLAQDFQRSYSLESAVRPPSTIVVSSEEPPSIPPRKGKERAMEDDSFEGSDNSGLLEDKIRIQLLEAEVERLRAEVGLLYFHLTVIGMFLPSSRIEVGAWKDEIAMIA